MNTITGLHKHFLLPALAGAAICYSVIILSNDDSQQLNKITELENKILDLQFLLAQQEQAFTTAQQYAPDTRIHNTTQISTANNGEKTAAFSASKSPADAELDAAAVTANSNQQLKELSTLSDRDARSFSEKLTDFLAQNPGRDNLAIASKSIVDLANNHSILPDYALESLYQQQSNEEIKRVAAQVMSLRGDNRLLEQHIAKLQTKLESDTPQERQQALVALAKTGYANAATAIAPLLQDSDTGVKLDALLALRATGNQSHIRMAENLRNDPDPAVSWLANDVISQLQNLSEQARTKVASNDIAANLLPIAQ